MEKKNNRKKRIRKYLGHLCWAIVSVGVMNPSAASAVDPLEAANEVIGAEGGSQVIKDVIEGALKISKSKPALSTATSIVCLACVPLTGATASPGLCIACGILIAKTFG